MKIENFKLKIISPILYLVIVSCFLMFAPSAQAGFIVKAPAYLGLNQGLAACWSLDGAYTKAPDCSGNNHTGTLANGPTKVQGKVGQALSFNSALSQHVNLGASNLYTPSGTGSTLSAWINSTSMQTTPKIVAFLRAAASTAHGLITDNATFQVYYRDGANTLTVLSAGTTFIVKDGSWHHVTAVINGTTITAYVDGIARASANDVNTANTYAFSSDAAAIASHVTGNFFTGSIDEVRFYHRALSDQEVYRLYQIGLGSTANRTNTTLTTQGLVGYWTFDGADIGNSGVTAEDRSGNSNNGTLTNGPTRVQGKVGQALRFDGGNDYVSISDKNTLDVVQMTASAWIKINALSDGNIISKWESTGSQLSFFFRISSAGHLVFGTDTDGAIGSPCGSVASAAGSLRTGIWYYVTATSDGTDFKVYIDGDLAGTGPCAGAFQGTANVEIGSLEATSGNPGELFNGSIDDVRLYNRALSAAEIQHLYDQYQSKFNSSQTDSLTQGLRGYWTFDGADIGNSGVTAKDRSGNSKNGTLTNGPTRVQGKVGQALSFDGVNDYVNIGAGSFFDITGDLTLSAWFYVRANAGGDGIIAKGGCFNQSCPWQMELGGAKTITFIQNDGSAGQDAISSTTALSVGRWYHIVAVRSGSNRSIYINGALDAGPTAWTRTPTANGDSVVVGIDGVGGSAEIDANIDDVRIYNRALSTPEIQKLYNMGR